MNKKDLTKKLKKMFSTEGTDPTKMEIAPFRNWRNVVIFFFAGVVVSVVFGAYLLKNVNEGDFFGKVESRPEVVQFDTKKLMLVLDSFKKKEALFEELKKNATPVVDPSL